MRGGRGGEGRGGEGRGGEGREGEGRGGEGQSIDGDGQMERWKCQQMNERQRVRTWGGVVSQEERAWTTRNHFQAFQLQLQNYKD